MRNFLFLILFLLSSCFLQNKVKDIKYTINSATNDERKLIISETLNDTKPLFTLNYVEKTSSDVFYENCKIFIILRDSNQKTYNHLLYRITINSSDFLIDDNYINNCNKIFYNNNPKHVFLPEKIPSGKYEFQIMLEHKKTGKVYSNILNIIIPLCN